ncbi:MAG: hypothetical protein IBJ00_05365, partial [Alphaproteobacteria bacterium]|nr:hypothetical protein [Alphaproteobacteria bacterium]
MKTFKAIIITTGLLLGSSTLTFASDTEDESNPPSSKRWAQGNTCPYFNRNGLPEERFEALPSEFLIQLISSLSRYDQVSVRSVSRSMKKLIDTHVWPNQSCTLKGECLSSAIDTIKFLPFRSLTLEFKRWEAEDFQCLPLLVGLTSLSMRGNQIGDAGAQALSQLTGLTALNIPSNRIGEAGAKDLS